MYINVATCTQKHDKYMSLSTKKISTKQDKMNTDANISNDGTHRTKTYIKHKLNSITKQY